MESRRRRLAHINLACNRVGYQAGTIFPHQLDLAAGVFYAGVNLSIAVFSVQVADDGALARARGGTIAF